MATGRNSATFGQPARRRREPHTIIIAQGQSVRHFTIRGRWLLIGTALATSLVLGCLSVPAYVAIENDGALPINAQHWRERDDYERRIAALRAQLDSATSRQFLSEKMVETKVDVLLDQQEELTARYDRLKPLFERARDTGLLSAPPPVPTAAPRLETGDRQQPFDSLGDDASASSLADAAVSPIKDATSKRATSAADPLAALSYAPFPPSAGVFTDIGGHPAPVTDVLRTGSTEAAAEPSTGPSGPQPGSDRHAALSATTMEAIGRAIGRAEIDQVHHLQALAQSARNRAVRMASAVEAVGITIPALATDKAEGGPYVPLPAGYRPGMGLDFDQSYAELEAALDVLQRVSDVVETLPLAEPMPSSAVSSTFGVRSDPFLGRPALHSGIDYAVPRGAPIRIEAAGTVTHAGPMGGYGNMVEIDHGHGVSTRYGHMSRIDVSVGDKLDKGSSVGAVGSTGRSTGPHLHYEVRLNDQAIDPERIYRIGRRIADLG